MTAAQPVFPRRRRAMKDVDQIAALVALCEYPGFSFGLVVEEGMLFLRVSASGPCSSTGEPITWRGRKWRLSPHMTDGEVVQTAWLATLTAIEHEARENFRFRGVSVFDPHYDIHKLVELRRRPGAIVERGPS